MLIGPQIAFVDDEEEQIKPLEDAVEELNTGSIYFDAKPELNKWPAKPLPSVKVLFLDLYYKKDFDPEISAQWVEKIIPRDSRYTLVVWSRDTDEVQKLIDVLHDIDLIPEYTEIWQKTDYDLKSHDFKPKIEKLIQTVSHENEITQEVMYGEVLEIEDNGILINCRLNMKEPVFQERRFDKEILKNIRDIKIGTYLKITIYTKPGARLIDITEEKKDRRKYFEVPDFFKGLEGGAFFIEG